MKPFELFITYISWGSGATSGGKNRPVLVLLVNDDTISVFPITTQYVNKSKAIQARYFKINDWSQAGLEKQSYIDTGTLLELPKLVIKNKKPIGKLTIADKQSLLAFITSSN